MTTDADAPTNPNVRIATADDATKNDVIVANKPLLTFDHVKGGVSRSEFVEVPIVLENEDMVLLSRRVSLGTIREFQRAQDKFASDTDSSLDDEGSIDFVIRFIREHIVDEYGNPLIPVDYDVNTLPFDIIMNIANTVVEYFGDAGKKVDA